ncbi:hypothetical protein B9479_007444 [Cryptococcus floricola]|uniref:Uncharacterized protein n=1 Tax=Cryptococcus floricola TaxID=2591691 RepID=A0A5D3AKB2_9TREE|nr:hypothetical protein B9479_007444 [Cryptococcus floricola]
MAQVPASPTAPGPPVRTSPSSSIAPSVPHTPAPIVDNPYDVDLVVPYSIALSKKDLKNRTKAELEIKEGYEQLLRAIEGHGGFKVATKPGRAGKGQEEVWVFISASEEKVERLVEEERQMDAAHNLPTPPVTFPPSPATRLRLIYNVLTAPALQGGLGITPGRGRWSRVKSIMALHDEAADHQWIEKWTTGGDWKVGLTKGLDEDTQRSGGLGDQQPPPVHLYFDFLTTYTLSLLPISVISVLFYLFTPADSYPPLYAFLLSVYASVFVAIWRVKQRKFAVRWGTIGCESMAISRLRPEYVASLGFDEKKDLQAVDAIQAGNELKRDTKVAASIPVIVACGVGLGIVLMGIFVLEAFVGEAYDGYGKEIVPLIPTALFSLLVPQIVAGYGYLAELMVKWEDHPTPTGEEKSLTAKTFAMNAIVAYLGLFLSAYVYIPFGSFIMGHVQNKLAGQGFSVEKVGGSGNGTVQTETGPGSSARGTGIDKAAINGGRLKSQLFAYTVTNQVVNAFLELGLPYILRFINEWRAGKTTLKEAITRRGSGPNGAGEKAPVTEDEVEKRFLDKVERELELPEYTLFTDYAEMVTQFGYVTLWSIVWPLAPIFALINNYIELRSDALKICKHVRRPVGDRVETIGSWLDTLGLISWLGAVTSSTLIYLFRPAPEGPSLGSQSANPNFPLPGSHALSHIVSTFHEHSSPANPFTSWINVHTLESLVPLALIALGASHGFLVLRWVVEGTVERVWWRGSWEERELGRLRAGGTGGVRSETSAVQEVREKVFAPEVLGGFWNGGEEGAREIARLIKAE